MKYFAFYDTAIGRRSMNLAAVNKIDYICSAIQRNGVPLEIVSCGMESKESIPPCVEKNDRGIDVLYFKTVKLGKTKLIRYLQTKRRNLILLVYILFHTKKTETILVYHSLAIMNVMYWAKRIKRFRLIVEAEEVYNDVFIRSQRSVRQEKRLFSAADAYIFPSAILNEKINVHCKPSVVIHGAYTLSDQRTVEKRLENQIHVIYSGSFDPNKGGVFAALECARYLPKNYHLHILGKGSRETEAYVAAFIAEHSEKDACEITYAGLLHGSEYTNYLKKCDIGLSTQNPNAKFNDTSFPSKILAYMSSNLRVVSARIRVVETSEIGKSIYYYEDHSGRSIADAILSVRFDDGYNGYNIVNTLDRQFCEDLMRIL